MEKIITLDEVLHNKNFRMRFKEIIINGDNPISITEEDKAVPEGNPQYSNAKEIGRSGEATAIISPNTLAVYTSENIEYPYPINWSDIVQNSIIDNNTKLYNRSHIIAYSLSAKNADENNIFIGTHYLNHTSMRNVEKLLYSKVKNNNRAYVYKVTPQYAENFDNDTIPIGVLMEAETIDNLEKDQFCRFCYNIQKGIKINYYDGSNKPIEKVYGTLNTWKLKEKSERNDVDNKFRDYFIDIRTNTFHLQSKNCNELKNVELKYIQETRANIYDVINITNADDTKKFKICEKCIKI